jgi:ribose 5-phosphate isomerase B
MPETIIIGSDHAGFALKQKVKAHLEQRGFGVEDIGSQFEQFVDYPRIAHELAEAVAGGRFARGVVMCGTGIGVSIVANRHAGVRAAMAYDEETARLARAHNDANVLALGGRSLDHELALRILGIWLDTGFEGGRHARRVALIELESARQPEDARGGSESAPSEPAAARTEVK